MYRWTLDGIAAQPGTSSAVISLTACHPADVESRSRLYLRARRGSPSPEANQEPRELCASYVGQLRKTPQMDAAQQNNASWATRA